MTTKTVTAEPAPSSPPADAAPPRALSALERLSQAQRRHIDVEFPELDITLRVHELSAGRKSDLERMVSARSKAISDTEFAITTDTFMMRAEAIVCCVTDLDGNPLATMDQVELLRELPANVVEQLFEAAWELNGFQRRNREVTTEKN